MAKENIKVVFTTCTQKAYLLVDEVQLKPIPRSKNRDYADWFNSLPWDFFCTFTTKYSMSLRTARRFMERLYERLKKINPKIWFTWFAEPFDTKDGYHTHALIYFGDSPLKDLKQCNLLLRKIWNQLSGQQANDKYTTFSPYVKDRGAHEYVAKYLFRNNADSDFYPGEI